MPKFFVHIPVSLDLVVEVEAESEAEDLEKGFEMEWSLNPEGAEIDACESHRDLMRGNVCYSVLSTAYAEKV